MPDRKIRSVVIFDRIGLLSSHELLFRRLGTPLFQDELPSALTERA
jgi:hypothetical protein